MMKSEKPITLRRECSAILVPSGEKITLPAGSSVWLTQSLGGSFTVMTDRGYTARIDGCDAAALGLPQTVDATPAESPVGDSVEAMEARVWDRLRSCFDPEIPVNIVDLGLVYDCIVTPLPNGGYKTAVRFTLTAQGCGMGEFLKADIRNKLLAVSGIREAQVDLVWEPPWNQSRISAPAKLELGIE
jgi:probable FeS assembly SUF system protein SufT